MLGGAGGVRQTGHRVAELVPGESAGCGPASAVCGVGTLTRPPCGGGRGTAALGTSQVSGRSPQRREQGKEAGRWKSKGPGGPGRRTRGGGRGVSWNEPEGRHLRGFMERSKAAPCCRQVASSLAILLGTLELSGERLRPSSLAPEQDRKPSRASGWCSGRVTQPAGFETALALLYLFYGLCKLFV